MKKCKKCGAVQGDARDTCLECGAWLGRPISAEEEAAINAKLDEQMENMDPSSEQVFRPTALEKIMGILCIFGLVAFILLCVFVDIEKQELLKTVPDTVLNSANAGIEHSNMEAYRTELDRLRECKEIPLWGLFGLFLLLVDCPMLLIPHVMWLIDTWKYRVYHNWDTPPSRFDVKFRKLMTRVFFVIGVAAMLYAYGLFLF